MSIREVVITGMGLITPLGRGVAENWENMRQMKTGLAHYPHDAAPGFLQYMGKVNDFEVDWEIPHKLQSQMKFLNRGSRLGFFAAHEALASSGTDLSIIPMGRRALYIASGDLTTVGYDFMYPAVKDGTAGSPHKMDFEKLNQSALYKVNPFFLLESIANNLFSFLSAYLEFMGSNTSLASHSPCGGNAMELAYRSISQGRADVAMAVGCGNWITEIPVYEMEGLGILSRCRDGVSSFRPFDRKRDGFIPGEGGAAVFLEEAGAAEKRGANIFARITGSGNCSEFSGDRGIGVSPRVSSRSIKLALEEAGIGMTDLAFISPHGSGSQKGDRSELNSILQTGGKDAGVPVCGLKPYTGHLGAASDVGEIIMGVRALKEKIAPATLNFTEAEGEFKEMKISGSHQPCEKKNFLSVSYGIGGQSSSLVVQIV